MNENTNILRDEAEEKAIKRLGTLARAHGAESRAADVVAEKVLIDRFRYSPTLSWLAWDGKRWDTDDTAEPRVVEAVRKFIDETERDYRVTQVEAEMGAAEIQRIVFERLGQDRIGGLLMLMKEAEIIDQHGTEDEKAAFARAQRDAIEARRQADIWLNLLSAGKIGSITKLCRGMAGIVTRSSEFDAWPDLLNCENCVVDLRSGEMLPHDARLLLTHMAGGSYDLTVRSVLWDKALEAVHADIREWFQIRMGQSITGHTPDDDSLVVNAGPGSNGKSAVISTILRASGSYGRLISHRVLLAQPGQHTTELTDLRGLRVAVLEETPEEGHLDTHRLKVTIGTPQITARQIRKDDITFDTSHTLWINTNFLPQVDTTDHGTWRRLRAMPWPFKFVKPSVPMIDENDRPGDLTLKPKLATDPDVPTAVLTWLIEGARRWYAADRISQQNPAMVEVATRAWRASTDVGYLFATEWLIGDSNGYVTAELMRAAFAHFLESQGKRGWAAQTLNTRLPDSLAEAGIYVDKTPVAVTKVRASDIQSIPPSEATGGPTLLNPTVVPAGKVIRMWRGVRFRTIAERHRADHLSAVS